MSLSAAGLQHPCQRRAALSGTLQSASQPPRTGKSSNGGGAETHAHDAKNCLNAGTFIHHDLPFIDALTCQPPNTLHHSGFVGFCPQIVQAFACKYAVPWWIWEVGVMRKECSWLFLPFTCWRKELNLRMKWNVAKSENVFQSLPQWSLARCQSYN